MLASSPIKIGSATIHYFSTSTFGSSNNLLISNLSYLFNLTGLAKEAGSS